MDLSFGQMFLFKIVKKKKKHVNIIKQFIAKIYQLKQKYISSDLTGILHMRIMQKFVFNICVIFTNITE